MPNNAPSGQAGSRLATLLSFLAQDPKNLPLLLDAAETALAEDRAETAEGLLARYMNLSPSDPEAMDRLGQAAMKTRHFAFASRLYGSIVEGEGCPVSVRYNLAYSEAMQRNFDRALELLDSTTTSALPQAAMLEVQILHDRGEFETALERGLAHLEQYPDHEGLNAAVSVLALDLEAPDLALRTARRSGQHPDALATLGTLALNDSDSERALGYFDRAIAINPHGARTWIGRGLARLSIGDTIGATEDLDQGADLFSDHIGSWIAAGWGHFIAGDLARSRSRFERAYNIDNAFAESLGSLAVLDAIEGNIRDAERKSLTALKLDRECFSATLAQTLLLTAAGHEQNARRLFEKALTTPIGKDRKTIAEFIAQSSF